MQKVQVLLLDNFDSFTYNLVDYLAQANISCDVRRNNEAFSAYKNNRYHGVMLSPGPEQPQKAGSLMEVLAYYAKRLPILGVCLGHQAIGELFGWQLTKAIKPMHGKVSNIRNAQSGIFTGLPHQFEVVRYHSLVLHEKANTPIIANAHSQQGEIMGLMHQELPIWGIQFHPEAVLTQHGHQLIRNWASTLH